MLLGALLVGAGLLAVLLGLWPGLLAVGLTGPAQAVVFFLGLGLLAWGSARLALRAGQDELR